MTLINTLDDFAKISGLKLNHEKCNVLKAGASKVNIQKQYLDHKHFLWSSEKAKALGITFTTNRKISLDLNLTPKLEEFKTCLKQWQHRKLTLLGKVTVIKTFALPKLIYPLTVLQTPPAQTIKSISDAIQTFLWDHKPAKIKRDLLTKDYEEGGIKLANIQYLINSLKCSWVKRIFQNPDDSPIKAMYQHILNQYGGKYLFECSLNQNDIQTLFRKNVFIKDILAAWNNITYIAAAESNFRTCLWNNSLIRSDNRPIFFKSWFEKSVKYLGDIYDLRTNAFYTFNQMKYLYNIPNNDFLKYLTLINSFPKAFLLNLKEEHETTASSKLIEKVIQAKRPNKILYTYQIEKQKTLTNLNIKWGKHFDTTDINWNIIFKLPFEATIDNKLRNFQYKYVMGIIRTNKELYKFSLTNSTLCDFCNTRQDSIYHRFWECECIQQLWNDLKTFLQERHINIELNFKNVSLGIHGLLRHKLSINYLIICTKYYIFKCFCCSHEPKFLHLKNYLNEMIRIEKCIAIRKGKLELHLSKWITLFDI